MLKEIKTPAPRVDDEFSDQLIKDYFAEYQRVLKTNSHYDELNVTRCIPTPAAPSSWSLRFRSENGIWRLELCSGVVQFSIPFKQLVRDKWEDALQDFDTIMITAQGGRLLYSTDAEMNESSSKWPALAKTTREAFFNISNPARLLENPATTNATAGQQLGHAANAVTGGSSAAGSLQTRAGVTPSDADLGIGATTVLDREIGEIKTKIFIQPCRLLLPYTIENERNRYRDIHVIGVVSAARLWRTKTAFSPNVLAVITTLLAMTVLS